MVSSKGDEVVGKGVVTRERDEIGVAEGLQLRPRSLIERCKLIVVF